MSVNKYFDLFIGPGCNTRQLHHKERRLSFRRMVAGVKSKNCALFDGAEIGSTKTIDLFALQCCYCKRLKHVNANDNNAYVEQLAA